MNLHKIALIALSLVLLGSYSAPNNAQAAAQTEYGPLGRPSLPIAFPPIKNITATKITIPNKHNGHFTVEVTVTFFDTPQPFNQPPLRHAPSVGIFNLTFDGNTRNGTEVSTAMRSATIATTKYMRGASTSNYNAKTVTNIFLDDLDKAKIQCDGIDFR